MSLQLKETPDARNKKRFLLLYSGLFILTLLFTFLPVFLKGKTTLYIDDCITEIYLLLSLKKQIFTEFIRNIKMHKFAIPFVSFSMSMDDNLLSFFGIEIMDILFLLTKKEYWETCFVITQGIRLWLSGAAFLLFLYYLYGSNFEQKQWIALFSSLAYAFGGFSIIYTYKFPIYVSLMYNLPILLLGIEKIIRENKKSLFIAAVAASAVCNLSLHYYATIICVFYCILRIFQIKNKKIIIVARNLIFSYLVGFGISMFLNLPLILSLTDSSKVTNGIHDTALIYGWDFFWETLVNFFVIQSYSSVQGAWTGITPVFLPVVICLFIKPGRYLQKFSLAAILILMNLPLMGTIAGLSTTNNRWTYCLCFVAAYILFSVLPELLFENNIKIKLTITVLSLLYAGIMVYHSDGSKNIILSAISIFIVIVFFNILWLQSEMAIKCLFLFSAFLAALFLNMKELPNIENMIEAGSINSYLDTFINAEALKIEDDGFYRIDHSNNQKYTSEWNCNLPVWYGYNGISGFLSVLNESFVSYLRDFGYIGLLNIPKATGFDGRTSDEILACTKYYLKDPVNPVVPYGFHKTENDLIYQSEYILPIGYTYNSVIPRADFEKLNAAEQQEIMLQSVVLDIESNNAGNERELKSKKLDLQTLTINKNVVVENDTFHILKNNGKITISVDVPENAELYVSVENVEIPGDKTYRIIVDFQDTSKNTFVLAENARYATNQNTYIFNLGQIQEGIQEISIRFSGGMYLGSVSCYARNIESVGKDVQKLADESMQNVTITTNQISGQVDLTSEKWLVFSLPYSKGWTAYVDGNKKELQKANIMYMGFNLSRGHHEITLNYFPYGMKTGIIISTVSILFWIFLLIEPVVIRKKR